MNKNLIEIGKNQYMVTNEKGETHFTVANKDGSKEILIKENELESSKEKLNDCEETLQVNTIKCIIGEISMFVGMPILFGLALTYTSPIIAILSYIPFKLLHIGAVGTRTKRLKERKNLKAEIEELKSNIPELENIIKQLKKDIQFKKYYIKDKESNKNTVTIVSNYEYYASEETKNTKPKVLSIGQKK